MIYDIYCAALLYVCPPMLFKNSWKLTENAESFSRSCTKSHYTYTFTHTHTQTHVLIPLIFWILGSNKKFKKID